MATSVTIILSLLGGLLPCLLWLWFWLKEDRLHPEPRRRIALVFFAGMCAVFLVFPAERAVFHLFDQNIGILMIVIWAFIEEISKFIATYFSALRSKEADEPIDAVIYMITGALGFSALENALFISNLLSDGLFTQGIITGNMRFLGATLLHTASSAVVGILYGLFFYTRTVSKKASLFIGLCIAIVLHSVFNLLIIQRSEEIFFVFSGIWIVIAVIIFFIERVKRVHP